MLLDGWDVLIGKNCDRGKPEVTVFPCTDQPLAGQSHFYHFLLTVNWLTSGFVYTTLPFYQLTRRLQSIRKKSNERTSE